MPGRRVDLAYHAAMHKSPYPCFARSAVLSMLLLGAPNIWAGLGQAPEAARASPLTRLAPVQPASGLYRINEIKLETGTTVQEYFAPGGVVFAVSWSGPVLPDFGALFGSYFDQFQRDTEAARASGKRGGPVHQEGTALVVQSQGRMRNFFGHAYAPALVPGGVTVQDVLR